MKKNIKYKTKNRKAILSIKSATIYHKKKRKKNEISEGSLLMEKKRKVKKYPWLAEINQKISDYVLVAVI